MTLLGLPHSEISGSGCQHLTGAYRSVATSFIGLRRQGIHPAPLLVGVLCFLSFGLRSRAWNRNVSVFANSAKAHKVVGGHLRRGATGHVGFVVYVDYRMWLVRCKGACRHLRQQESGE